MTALEVLSAARQLIADPARWTQDVAARDMAGEPVLPHARTAARWCAIGAIDRTCGQLDDAEQAPLYLAAILQLAQACEHLYDCGTITANDHHGHAAVVAAFDLAIKDEALRPLTLLTVAEAAEVIGISISEVRRYCAAGRLAARRPGRDWLIDAADAARFKEIPRRRGRPAK